MHMLVMKNTANNTMYMCKNYTLFYKHSVELYLMKLHLKPFISVNISSTFFN